MSRAFCYQCHRAKVACLCGRVEKQANQVKLIVLQHPDEASNKKATAIIAELGLQQYQLWQGEDFTQHAELGRLLADKVNKLGILYPAEGAELLVDTLPGRAEIEYLIVIDATWRKARKIWQLNPQLHKLRALSFDKSRVSEYRIRKQPQTGYLSTLESVVVALRVLECRPLAYQGLLELFDEMIDFQIEQMGEDIYKRNYPVDMGD